MKYSSLIAALVTLSLAACSQKTAETPASPTPDAQAPAAAPAVALPAGHPSVDPANMVQPAPLPALTQKGQVLSVLNITQYTYLEVKQDDKTRWLATTTSPAKKGDTIQFDDGMVMTNFNSKVLNRTFPSITFVGRVVIDSGKS